MNWRSWSTSTSHILGLAILTGLAACAQVEPVSAERAARIIEPDTARYLQDAEAHGGRAAILHQDERARFDLQAVPGGWYKVGVRARAQAYQGWPTLRLYLGEQQLGQDNAVERIGYGEGDQRFGEAVLLRGEPLNAAFVNDRYDGPGKDRNLFIDHLVLEPLPGTPTQLTQILVDDMVLPHEARPHGVPERLHWRDAPRVGMGNDPGNFRALTAWGQLYEAAEGNPATNTRAQLRNLQTFVLSRDGTWQRVQNAPTVEGAAYREDYVDDISKPADVRPESSGGVSVTAGGGYNFHFWSPSPRVSIDPGDIAGVVTAVEARLVLGNADKPDDRSEARYVLSVGADYWLDEEATWDNWETNGDVGIGRFKRVTEDWRVFTMSTVPTEVLRRNPPPLEAADAQP